MMARYMLQFEEAVHAIGPSETLPAGKRARMSLWVTVVGGSELEVDK